MVLNTKRLVVAGACAFASALAVAPSAQAQFTLADCQGGSAAGRGASFQQTAQQNAWIPTFKTASTTFQACPASTGFAGTLTYDPAGSGAGRRAFGGLGGSNPAGTRDATIRFIGYDEAPTSAEQTQMEEGTTVNAAADADDGNLLTIPVTTGAVTVLVNVPDGCTTSGEITPTNAQVEQAFARDSAVDTWGELAPGITGTVTGTSTSCAAFPITRVVRQDSSGTTSQFKAFLDFQSSTRDADSSAAGTQSWRAYSTDNPVQVEAGNTVWPDASTNLVRGATSGASSQVDALTATDGGIAYADLAVARAKGYTGTAAGGGDKRWLTLRDAAGNPVEPTANASSRTNGVKGSNCSSATQYTNRGVAGGALPNAAGDWSQVVSNIPNNGYPICALTYVGAWEDACDVYGSSATEQSRARTVKDYLEYLNSAFAQNQAVANDYGLRPSALTTIATNGIASIAWAVPAGNGTCV